MEQTVTTETEQTVAAALEQAERFRQKKQFTKARDLLIDVLQHNVEAAQIYFRLGNIYHDQKDFDHAEYAYRRAIDHDATYINAHHNLSVVFRRQGRLAESVKQSRKASKIARQHPEKIEFSDEQVTSLRSFAKRILVFGLGIIAVIALLLFIFSR